MLLVLNSIESIDCLYLYTIFIEKDRLKKYNNTMSFVLTFMGIAIVIENLLIGVIVDLSKMLFSNIYGIELGNKLRYSVGSLLIGLCSLFYRKFNFIKNYNRSIN